MPGTTEGVGGHTPKKFEKAEKLGLDISMRCGFIIDGFKVPETGNAPYIIEGLKNDQWDELLCKSRLVFDSETLARHGIDATGNLVGQCLAVDLESKVLDESKSIEGQLGPDDLLILEIMKKEGYSWHYENSSISYGFNGPRYALALISPKKKTSSQIPFYEMKLEIYKEDYEKLKEFHHMFNRYRPIAMIAKFKIQR